MSDKYVEAKLESLEKGQKESTSAMHEVAQKLTQVIERLDSSNVRITKLEDADSDKEKRLRALENNQAANNTKWKIFGAVGLSLLGFFLSIYLLFIKPQVTQQSVVADQLNILIEEIQKSKE